MAKGIADCTILYGPLDLSAHSNYFTLESAAEMKESTTWESGRWREFLPGLKQVTWEVTGFYEAAEPDASLFSPPAGLIVSASKSNPMAAGDVTWSFRSERENYSPAFQLGELAGLSASGQGSLLMVRGRCLESATVTATSNGTMQNFGAVLSTQRAYAILHVRSVSGTTPTLDAIVQSDDADGFPSPTNRLTFAQVTDNPLTWFQWVELAGPITDTRWRVARTVGGTGSPSFVYRILLAIQ